MKEIIGKNKKMKRASIFVILTLFIFPRLVLAYSTGSGWSLSNDFSLPESSLYEIIENILMWLLAILGIAGVLGFVISGIMYLISAGDDDLAGKAKDAMKYSIYGVIVGLIGFVVIKAVEAMLNAETRF
ncbi:MAG: hypothetical protein ACOYS2_02130 [Patescibacteria group bacterium]